MRPVFYRSPGFWFFLLAAIPWWFCLVLVFNFETDKHWYRAHVLSFLYLAVLLPVLEEIVFRGFVQDSLVRITGRRDTAIISPANLLTSLIFTALHFIYHPPLWALLVFVPSLILGYTKDRYQSLLAPVLLHVFYNVGYFMIFGAGRL